MYSQQFRARQVEQKDTKTFKHFFMYRWNKKQMTGKRVYDLLSEIATQFTCAEGMVELNHRRGSISHRTMADFP